MHTENLGAALRIFVVGFGGVFLNLALLLVALKVIGAAVARLETSPRDKERPEQSAGTATAKERKES